MLEIVEQKDSLRNMLEEDRQRWAEFLNLIDWASDDLDDTFPHEERVRQMLSIFYSADSNEPVDHVEETDSQLTDNSGKTELSAEEEEFEEIFREQCLLDSDSPVSFDLLNDMMETDEKDATSFQFNGKSVDLNELISSQDMQFWKNSFDQEETPIIGEDGAKTVNADEVDEADEADEFSQIVDNMSQTSSIPDDFEFNQSESNELEMKEEERRQIELKEKELKEKELKEKELKKKELEEKELKEIQWKEMQWKEMQLKSTQSKNIQSKYSQSIELKSNESQLKKSKLNHLELEESKSNYLESDQLELFQFESRESELSESNDSFDFDGSSVDLDELISYKEMEFWRNSFDEEEVDSKPNCYRDCCNQRRPSGGETVAQHKRLQNKIQEKIQVYDQLELNTRRFRAKAEPQKDWGSLGVKFQNRGSVRSLVSAWELNHLQQSGRNHQIPTPIEDSNEEPLDISPKQTVTKRKKTAKVKKLDSELNTSPELNIGPELNLVSEVNPNSEVNKNPTDGLWSNWQIVLSIWILIFSYLIISVLFY